METDALPGVLVAYWKAANSGEIRAAADCFSPDAIVLDEGQTHRGLPAIHSWIENTTRQYHSVVEPLQWSWQDGGHHVTARVSGTFPGSPVELDFLFTLQDNHIVRLEIL